MEIDLQPGVLRWLLSCDESGTHGARYYAFGTLWMPWQRRGDFSDRVRKLREDHAYTSEMKWTNVKSRHLAFYDDVVEFFFRTHWLSFHCCVIEKSIVRKELHQGDYDLARRKHFGMLLKNKIRTCIRAHADREQTFRLLVDPIHSRYSKADLATEAICNNALAGTVGKRPVDKVFSRDSKETPSIQLCDTLLGAVRDAWEQDARSDAKLDLQGWIAHHIGWTDLRADTRPAERKFNIWVFHDPTKGERRASTRSVSLRYPLPQRSH